ncbi:hypothetical protein [Nevskia ramosa]|uniref:hypothetical protein n=1 Tax=Nevskia ramosa TaxID=64002 RepID=UPI003D1001E9
MPQSAATVDNLIDLFRHVIRSGMPANNVTVFLSDPRGYIVNYMSTADGGSNNPPRLAKMVLSNRQAAHLTAGAAIANELSGIMYVGMTSYEWMPGAIASVTACRPTYKGPVYLASYAGVGANVIPSDPLASMLWGWKNFTQTDKDDVVEILNILKASGTQPIKEVADELLTYILK